MFDFLKSKKVHTLTCYAKGELVDIKEVPDPTFSDEILGKGVAIIPSEGKFYAPCDGEIALIFDTLHAISITTEYGAEVLIHIGLDTVQLKGAPFTAHVEVGQQVKKGDLLITADLDMIREHELNIITPMIICNTEEYKKITPKPPKTVDIQDEMLTVEEK